METVQPNILTMYHPELNASGDTTQEGYDMIYSHRGWVLLDPAESAATELLGRPVLDLKDLTANELRQLISSLGAPDPAANATKNSLVKTATAVAGGQPVPADEEDDEDDSSKKDPKPSGAAKATAK